MTTPPQVNTFFSEFLKKLKNESMAVWFLTAFLGYQMYVNHANADTRKAEFDEKMAVDRADIEAKNKHTKVLEQILAHFEQESEDRAEVYERLFSQQTKIIEGQGKIINGQIEIKNLVKWRNIN